MSNSIKFDSTELLNGTYLPRYAKHESAPPRNLAMVQLSGDDGSVLVSEKYGAKTITVIGKLTAASRSALDTAMDAFKLLFSGKEKVLDISWEGSTRRYVATCESHTFNRDAYHNLFVPWSATFVVATGIGEAISETTKINAYQFTASSDYDEDLAFDGSADPKPRFTIHIVAGETDAKGLQIKNGDTGEKIIMTRSGGFGANKIFEVDCRLKTAKYDGVAHDFHGVFPKFIAGTNNIEVKLGRILDQEFDSEDYTDSLSIYDDIAKAMSFTVPNTDATYEGIALYLSKTGTPPGALTIRIETDSPDIGSNTGTPSGTLVHANATCTLSAGEVSTGGWIFDNLDGIVTLQANTRYWIVLQTSGGAPTDKYNWHSDSGVNATYSRGIASNGDIGLNTWVNYADTQAQFRLYYGGKFTTATPILSIYYYKRYL